MMTTDPTMRGRRQKAQALQRLALSIRHFLELGRSVQRRLTEGGPSNRVDDPKLKKDWRAFNQHAADLQKRLEQTVADLPQNDTAVSDFAKLLGEQNDHYQSWFKILSRTTGLAKAGTLLEELPPHSRPVTTLHPRLCCSAPVLSAVAVLVKEDS